MKTCFVVVYWFVLEMNGMRPPFKFLVSFKLYGDVVLYFHSLYVVLHDNILFI
jgi:hypothetical protein